MKQPARIGPALSALRDRLGFSLVLMALIAAVGAPVLAPVSPTAQRLDARFERPGTPGSLLGTDDLGRDLGSRLLHGARVSLGVAGFAVVPAMVIGTLLGLLAAFGGRLREELLLLPADAVLSFPTVLLAVAVVAVFSYGMFSVTVSIAVVFTPVYLRMVRAEARALRETEYFQSSRALGSPWRRTLVLHVFPALVPRLAVQTAVLFALAIVIESSLSYLGLGIQPPQPSWGLILRDARNYLAVAPWLSIFPGVAIAATVLGFNLVADSISDRWSQR